MARNKIKVAIVGGGPAGLTAAYELASHEPERYDITIYQMGWRVGGKGASGYRRYAFDSVSPPIWNRIEEHGLHILFGFYDSTFNVLRRVYSDVSRQAKGEPGLTDFDEAFEPRDLGSVMHRRLSRWNIWNLSMPRNTQSLGVAPGGRINPVDPGDTLRTVVLSAVSFLREILLIPYGDQPTPRADSAATHAYRWAGRLLAGCMSRGYLLALDNRASTDQLLRSIQTILHSVSGAVELTTASYLAWHAADYVVAALRGAVAYGLTCDADFEGEDLEAQDYRDFLLAHGLHRRSLHGPFVDVIYHAAFSFAEGDTTRPTVAAGTALRLILQVMHYKGAAFYKMRGGMGDVVFMPLYRALKAKNVKFKFFHRVNAYRLDEAKTQIAQIDIDVQARLKPGLAEYDPRIVVGESPGFYAFPSCPLIEQLSNPPETVANTESYYDDTVVARETLVVGKDFDMVIAATPIETLRHIAQELCDGRPSTWKPMLDHVSAVQTVSAQFWFDRSLRELGWNTPRFGIRPDTLLSLYWKPVSTFCPMDQTLDRENWGQEKPKSVIYVTGVHPGPLHSPTKAQDPGFEAREQREARRLTRDFVNYFIAEDLLQGLEHPDAPPSPDWQRLVDPEGRLGSKRLAAQYVRSNNDPSARCTIAEPGGTKFRLRAGDSGYPNLVLAGDWTRNGVNCACMEGAFRSGLQAADALLLRCEHIEDEVDMQRDVFEIRVGLGRP